MNDANDTISYCSADYIGTAADKLQHSFNALQSAFYNHKLVLNVKKVYAVFQSL